MGLGPANDVPLAEARDAAALARASIRAGLDPLQEKQKVATAKRAGSGPSFAAAAEAYIEAHRAGWRNAKHGAQWHASLSQHAFPVLGDLPVASVDTDAVMRVLEPIWTVIPETAARLRGRVELVLDFAAAKGWRTGENPARWRGLVAHMLPQRSKVAAVVHHAAVPHEALPAVMARLAESNGIGALAVRFATLTAARSSEVRSATWAEFDLAKAVWTVPGARMKAGRAHRVPLSPAALAVLERAKALPGAGDYAFPGGRVGRPLTDVALSKALHLAAGTDAVTVHGLRSSFRDWIGETTAFPGDVAEMALAHTVRDKVEAAYRRGDLFDKRRELMDAWAEYCTAAPQV